MYVVSSYSCALVLGWGQFVGLLFYVLSDSIVGRLEVKQFIWLAWKIVFRLFQEWYEDYGLLRRMSFWIAYLLRYLLDPTDVTLTLLGRNLMGMDGPARYDLI